MGGRRLEGALFFAAAVAYSLLTGAVLRLPPLLRSGPPCSSWAMACGTVCLKEIIKTGVNTDVGKFQKLAQHVEKSIQDYMYLKEPKQLDPQLVLVAPMNRDRAHPNPMHIHNVILKSFITKEYDRTRPQDGICIEYTSVEGRRELIEHNLRFSKGCSLLPAIDESRAMYGSLAGSHFNLALRLIQAGAISPAG